MSLRQAWERNASQWVAWARAEGHDSYSQFHGRRFLEIVPPPGRLTIDVGAGEGRLGRDLVRLGHRVVAIDASPSLARAAARHPGEPLRAVVADAVQLPLPTGVADLAVAFMSMQDMDDLDSAVHECARVLASGGRLCVAVVHPLNSAGAFAGPPDDDAPPFVVSASYFEHRRYEDTVERNGLTMTFVSDHRPIEAYARALAAAGFLIDAIREVTVDDAADRWARIPMFLHLRAVRS
jgi:SAM-dependent methyltransferase